MGRSPGHGDPRHYEEDITKLKARIKALEALLAEKENPKKRVKIINSGESIEQMLKGK